MKTYSREEVLAEIGEYQLAILDQEGIIAIERFEDAVQEVWSVVDGGYSVICR